MFLVTWSLCLTVFFIQATAKKKHVGRGKTRVEGYFRNLYLHLFSTIYLFLLTLSNKHLVLHWLLESKFIPYKREDEYRNTIYVRSKMKLSCHPACPEVLDTTNAVYILRKNNSVLKTKFLFPGLSSKLSKICVSNPVILL